jgi:hypothetical protein
MKKHCIYMEAMMAENALKAFSNSISVRGERVIKRFSAALLTECAFTLFRDVPMEPHEIFQGRNCTSLST